MNEWEPPPLCTGCKEPLNGTEMEHGEEGFGHQGRCCRCYEFRIRHGRDFRAAPEQP